MSLAENLNIDYKGFESQVEIVKTADKGCTFDECALYLDRRLMVNQNELS